MTAKVYAKKEGRDRLRGHQCRSGGKIRVHQHDHLNADGPSIFKQEKRKRSMLTTRGEGSGPNRSGSVNSKYMKKRGGRLGQATESRLSLNLGGEGKEGEKKRHDQTKKNAGKVREHACRKKPSTVSLIGTIPKTGEKPEQKFSRGSGKRGVEKRERR